MSISAASRGAGKGDVFMTGSKVAVVTCGSRGIGRVVAERLASDGAAVAVGYAASSEAAREVVKAVRLAGGSAVAVRADVADPEQVAALFGQAESEFGGVNIVVTAAGIMRPALIAEATDKDFTEQVEVNVRGTFDALRQAARRVPDGGRMVTLSSTTLALNAPGPASATRPRVRSKGLPGSWPTRWARGVTVNAVAPGPVETELFLAGKSESDVGRLAGQAPQHRIGEPADIAGAVALLVSPDAGWISGQVIRVDGAVA